MEELPDKKIIFATPWIFAAAVGLLLIIVLVFAVNNLQREQRLATENLLSQGQGVIRMLEAGTRATTMRMGDNDSGYLQHLVEQAAAEPEIVYIALVDREGTILAHNRLELVDTALPYPPPTTALEDSDGATTHQLRHDPELETPVFEVSAAFNPFAGRGGRHWQERMEHHRPHMMRRMGPTGDPADPLLQAVASGELLILVGLDMREAERVISQNRRHIIIVSLALLLVGIGGWLALLGAQGYRTAARTLGYVQAFTGLLISRLPLGIIAVDRQGRVETCNEVAAAMCGVNAPEVIGRPAAKVLPELIVSHLREPLSTEEIIDRELRLAPSTEAVAAAEPTVSGDATPHGATALPGATALTADAAHSDASAHSGAKADGGLSVMLSAVPIRDREQLIIGRTVLLHDVTQLQAMEKEVQRHERLVALGKMAAGVAHEIRNPLSSIKGLATLLASKSGEEPQNRESARLLVSEVERVNRSISELLDFARPRPLHRQAVDLGELLNNSLQLVAADARSLGVELQLQLPTGAAPLPPVMVDADRLTQVLLNLYLNSLQAMPEGGHLEVDLEVGSKVGPEVGPEHAPEEEQLRIMVRDTGRGIAPEILPRITDPYFTTKPEGSGLGLALVQKIIDDHGGSIDFSSRTDGPDRGTTVTITLPVTIRQGH